MRLMSSRSSISCVWTRALRSMVSSPLADLLGIGRARAENLRPAEDGVERRAQLVRQGRQEVVLHVAHPLGGVAGRALAFEQRLALVGGLAGRLVQPRVVDARCRPARPRRDEPFGALGEDRRLRVTEEQAADHLAGASSAPARPGSCAPAGARSACRRADCSARSATSSSTSSQRMSASPRNVGPNSAVARGTPNCSNASRGAPDSV